MDHAYAIARVVATSVQLATDASAPDHCKNVIDGKTRLELLVGASRLIDALIRVVGDGRSALKGRCGETSTCWRGGRLGRVIRKNMG